MQAEPWAALAEGGIPVTRIMGDGTLDFFPDSGEDVEDIGVVGDGELSGGAGGAAEETDFVFGIVGDAVSKSWEWDVAGSFERFRV